MAFPDSTFEVVTIPGTVIAQFKKIKMMKSRAVKCYQDKSPNKTDLKHGTVPMHSMHRIL